MAPIVGAYRVNVRVKRRVLVVLSELCFTSQEHEADYEVISPKRATGSMFLSSGGRQPLSAKPALSGCKMDHALLVVLASLVNTPPQKKTPKYVEPPSLGLGYRPVVVNNPSELSIRGKSDSMRVRGGERGAIFKCAPLAAI